MRPWTHGTFGCFDNLGLCIITYFAPCYTFGKNAEAVGESCFLYGLLYFVPLVDIFALLKVRGKIRATSEIPGGISEDLLMILCCHFCALVQEAQEVQAPSENFTVMRQ